MSKSEGIRAALSSLKKATDRMKSTPDPTGQLGAIIEDLSNTADSLSFYQDQVATEAYLVTARERISVRRHSRIIVVCGTDLAKILAYACQKDSSMVVWVAQRFGKEHRDALEWLNESRKSKADPLFFGVVVKLVQTKHQPPVPKFKLFLVPNGWSDKDGSISHPQKAMVGEIAIQAGISEQDVENLYDSWFVETCSDWVVPYIGDLVGVRILPAILKTSFGSFRGARLTAAGKEGKVRSVRPFGTTSFGNRCPA